MGSIAAQEVAKEVLKQVESGVKPVIGKIAVKKGYSKRTADSGKIQKTKTYIQTLAPVVTRLERLRDRAIQALEEKDLTNERAKDVADMIKGYTHDIQLLGGKSTENIAVKPIYGGNSLPGHNSDEKDISAE